MNEREHMEMSKLLAKLVHLLNSRAVTFRTIEECENVHQVVDELYFLLHGGYKNDEDTKYIPKNPFLGM